jgi:CubicO group peptidase (beta-lactamase class C family)
MDDRISHMLKSLVVERGVAPGAVAAWARRKHGLWQRGVGAAGQLGVHDARPTTPDVVFDLASVTKPLFTCTVARLVERGLFGFERSVGPWLEEAADAEVAELPLEWLLSHRSGLEAHVELFAKVRQGERFDQHVALTTAAKARRSDLGAAHATDGYPPVYSDLGYILAGVAVERALGEPLDAIVRRELCNPLGLSVGSARQQSAEHPSPTFAPTEVTPWRGGLLSGVVHDDNAFVLSGLGTSGHAGLFGRADDLLNFGARLLDCAAHRDTTWLSKSTLDRLLRERPGGSLRCGFDGKSGPGSLAGQALGPGTFGHLGFTGTSLWCDPDADLVVVLLTNRVHPSRDNSRIREVRPIINDQLVEFAHLEA